MLVSLIEISSQQLDFTMPFLKQVAGVQNLPWFVQASVSVEQFKVYGALFVL